MQVGSMLALDERGSLFEAHGGVTVAMPMLSGKLSKQAF
jgi:hypothetical protein